MQSWGGQQSALQQVRLRLRGGCVCSTILKHTALVSDKGVQEQQAPQCCCLGHSGVTRPAAACCVKC